MTNVLLAYAAAALIGAALVVAGVCVLIGLGWALITGGIFALVGAETLRRGMTGGG